MILRLSILCGFILSFASGALAAEEKLQPASSPGESVRVAVSPPLYELLRSASVILKKDSNVVCKLTKAPASNAALWIGQGIVELAFTTRLPNAEERAAYPDVDLRAVPVGEQTIVMAVSRDVWDGGIRALSAEDVRKIYEKRVTNWNELGGPDLKIAFFTSDEGRGVWELFAEWLYQNTQRAPLGRFPAMKTHEEARDSIEFSPGAMTFLSPAFVTPPSSNILGIKLEGGEVVMPTPENVESGKYPMRRSIYVLVNEKPAGNARPVFHFFQTETGRALLKQFGCIPAKDEAENL